MGEQRGTFVTETLHVYDGGRQVTVYLPPDPPETSAADQPRMLPRPCPCCGGRMFIIETFARGCQPKHRPTRVTAAFRIDTS